MILFSLEDKILKSVRLTPVKSCELDATPTFLVLHCISVLLTPITSTINFSLQKGSFLSWLKTAYVTPLLKKPSRDQNYRPVSNLSFLSKLLERIVAQQLHYFLSTTDALPYFQSAYRRFHSTETALLEVFFRYLLSNR